MLSYRHEYHAGNHADVLKHIVLVEILGYLALKEKGFVYIDTHAGAGGYKLSGKASETTGEYRLGVGSLDLASLEKITAYPHLLTRLHTERGAAFYPGSPMLVAAMLRPQDQAWLFELHPADFSRLRATFASQRGIHPRNTDGFKGLTGLLPPQRRRGCILVDPPYEIKKDYKVVADTIAEACRKFATGVYALWYPIIERETINKLKRRFQALEIRNIVCFELCIEADTGGRGMTGSGMIVINPPWKLMSTMEKVLPLLTAQMAQAEGAGFTAEMLVPE